MSHSKMPKAYEEPELQIAQEWEDLSPEEQASWLRRAEQNAQQVQADLDAERVAQQRAASFEGLSTRWREWWSDFAWDTAPEMAHDLQNIDKLRNEGTSSQLVVDVAYALGQCDGALALKWVLETREELLAATYELMED